jgi:uncharacterized membrane protein
LNSEKLEIAQRARVRRLTYLDWMRGVAVLIMLQGHAMDAWVRPHDRLGERFWLSQFLGGLPAPIFLFLVGASLAMVIDKLRTRQASAWQISKAVFRRSGWILLLAYVFRLQQFFVWYPNSEWSGLLKVDTLNCIGACMGLLGLACLPFRTRRATAIFAGIAAGLIVFLTPFIYPLRVGGSWLLQSYFNGAGHSEFFSVIPWIGFCLVGMAFGWMMLEARSRGFEHRFFLTIACIGIAVYTAGAILSRFPQFMYGFFDYSLTSPYFFLTRLGLVLLILFGAYRWSLRSHSERWSPLRTLGQASLVVYWVHIELVYGRALHDWNQSMAIGDAALHLLWFIPGMLLLAYASRNWRTLWGFASALLNVREERAVIDRASSSVS